MADGEAILFSNGEAILAEDFNDLTDAATQRAWEVPGWADFFAHAPLAVGGTYGAQFGSANADSLGVAVYTKGGALGPTWSGLDIFLDAGMMGVYLGAIPPFALDPQTAWLHYEGEYTHTFTPAAAGLKRIDMIVVAVQEVNGGSVSRDFRDNVTGALTTTSGNKRRLLQYTFSVVPGISESAAPTGSNVAGLSGSYRIVALVTVNDTEIESVQDLTIPGGAGHVDLVRLSSNHIYTGSTSGWTVDGGGGLTSNTSGRSVIIYPNRFAGDPTAKLLGFEMKYDSGGLIAKLVQFEFGTGPNVAAPTVLEDLTSSLAVGPNVTRIDLRGYPHAGSINMGPVWGHGGRFKSGAVVASGGDYGKCIGLQLTSTASPDLVSWVAWLWAKG